MADGLHDALQHVDIFPDGDEQSERRTDVQNARDHASPGNRAGQGAARVLYFVSHDGGEFESHQTKTNYAEGIEDEARVGRNFEIRNGDGGAEARPDHDAEADQNRSGDECSDRAEIIDPLADAETDDIQKSKKSKQNEGSGGGEDFVLGEAEMRRPEHIDGDADEVEHDGRHVEHVVGPVAPAGEKSVEVPEDFFGPEIDSAFAGIAMGEFDDGDALRPEEKKKGDDPKPDGDATVRRDRGDNVEVEDRNDEKEDEIAASERADQVGLRGGLGFGRGQRFFASCEHQVPHRVSPGSE